MDHERRLRDLPYARPQLKHQDQAAAVRPSTVVMIATCSSSGLLCRTLLGSFSFDGHNDTMTRFVHAWTPTARGKLERGLMRLIATLASVFFASSARSIFTARLAKIDRMRLKRVQNKAAAIERDNPLDRGTSKRAPPKGWA